MNVLSIEEDRIHIEAATKRLTLARLKALRAKLGELLPALHLAKVKLESAIDAREGDDSGEIFPAISELNEINFPALLAFAGDDRRGLERIMCAEIEPLKKIVRSLDITSPDPVKADTERAKLFELADSMTQSAMLLEVLESRPR